MAANDASGQRLQSAPKKKRASKKVSRKLWVKNIFSQYLLSCYSPFPGYDPHTMKDILKNAPPRWTINTFFLFIYRPDQNPLRFSNAANVQFKIPAKFTMQRATARAWWSGRTSSVGNCTATWYALARTRSIRRCRVAKLKLLQAGWSSQNTVCLATTIPISKFTT